MSKPPNDEWTDSEWSTLSASQKRAERWRERALAAEARVEELERHVRDIKHIAARTEADDFVAGVVFDLCNKALGVNDE
jgi:hypothetical protein